MDLCILGALGGFAVVKKLRAVGLAHFAALVAVRKAGKIASGWVAFTVAARAIPGQRYAAAGADLLGRVDLVLGLGLASFLGAKDLQLDAACLLAGRRDVAQRDQGGAAGLIKVRAELCEEDIARVDFKAPTALVTFAGDCDQVDHMLAGGQLVGVQRVRQLAATAGRDRDIIDQ